MKNVEFIIKPQTKPLTAEETVADAKARAARQEELEADWTASVGSKGLGHGNKRNKLNVNIIDDQDSCE